MPVLAREQPIGKPVHLAVEAGGRKGVKGHSAGGPVLHCYRGGVAFLEGSREKRTWATEAM